MCRIKQNIWFSVFAIFISFFTSCASVGIMRETYTDPAVMPVEVLCPVEICEEWNCCAVEDNGQSDGDEDWAVVEFIDYYVEQIKVNWACVKIDLQAEGLSFIATPTEESLGKRYSLLKIKYPNEKVPVVSLNTTPFDLDGRTYIPVSVIKIDGKEICPPNSQYSALCLKKIDLGWSAHIISSQNEDFISECEYAFGGFYQILDNGEIAEFAKYKRSRTACGISENGRYLYLFAACGKNCPTGRNGLNFEECAVILQALGCEQAMEFDGGHSTGLTLNGKNLIKPSLQRKIPATLAFFLN